MTRRFFRGRLAAAAVALLLAGCRAEPEFSLRRVAVDPAGGGDATLSPDGRRLLTTSRRSGNWDLWSFDLETSRWTRLTDDPAEDFEGRWSPDGRRIAFTSTRSGIKNVWILDLKTHAVTQLTHSTEGEDEYPVWSPDGRSVLYTGGVWGKRDYYLVPASGGEPRKVSRDSARAGACSFEPGGDSLVCHRYDLGSGDVLRLWLNGDVAPLTAGSAWDYKPTESPDGQWIAFSRSEEGPSYIAVMPAAGGRVRRLTQSPYDDRWPTWSAAGDRLLFHRLVNRGTALELLDLESGRVRTLAGPDEAPLQGSVDPAGERVAYCSQLADRMALKLLDLHTGERRLLSTGPGEACFPRWSPDGRRIAYAGKTAERWEIRTIDPDGADRASLTEGMPLLHGMDGPVDWSPDGRRILFHSDTDPFEANLFAVDVKTRRVASLTSGPWFDESPSWAPDGRHVLFMSTRGGDWTWGLFQMSLADGKVETLAGPDWEEKNFPRMGPDGAVVWSFHDAKGLERLALRDGNGSVRVLEAAGTGARWPSFATDGRRILFTRVEHEVEFWLAENPLGRGSPALRPAAPASTPEPARSGARQANWNGPDRSPVDLHRR